MFNVVYTAFNYGRALIVWYFLFFPSYCDVIVIIIILQQAGDIIHERIVINANKYKY